MEQHIPTLEEIESAAEADVCIRLPIIARSRTSNPWKPEPTTAEGRVYSLDEYLLPTPAQLNRHVQLYGREGTDGIRSIVVKPEAPDELATKSAEANVKEQTRKRTVRRTGIKEQAKALLAHSPELNYKALADALNIGDRRAKSLLDELAISA